MSTQQILGVVGGVVGAFFGYPQLGFVVGSLVGGLLTPAGKVEGPRVDDLKVQVSTYGAGIPILYGTERVGGNVVWSTDKIEIAEESGGKGGEPEQTSYRYFVHMGIVLCETPRDGSTVSIVQIFQDGKLIYDAHSGIPVGSALASAENPYAYFVLYQGHADQLPDPGEEAWMGGPGSVPAYRGVVRIRMNAVECPGGRVPQFSFVISTRFTMVTEKSLLSSVPNLSGSTIALVGLEQTLHIREVADDPNYYLEQTLVGNGYSTRLARISLPARGNSCSPVNGTAYGSAFVARDAGVGYTSGSYFDQPKWLELIDMQSGVASHLLDYEGHDTQHCFVGEQLRIAFDPTTNLYAAALYGDVSFGNVYALNPIIIDAGVARHVATAIPGGIVESLAMYGGVLAVLNLRDAFYYVRRYAADTGEFIDEVAGPGNNGLPQSQKSALRFDANGLFAWVLVHGSADAAVYQIDSAWNLLCSDAHSPGGKDANFPTTIYADKNVCVIGPGSGDPRAYYLIRYRAVSTDPVKIKDIIAEQCDRVGEPRFDVSGIPDADTIHGYKLQNPANARANIDPVLTAFAAYMVDEDGAIKFKKYEDVESMASISYDELGQAEDGSEPLDAMPLNRAQEVDLPRSVSVSYLEPLRDYQTASEKEVRQITEANEDLVVELPLATTSDHAKQVAQTILFDRWRAQNTRSCKVSRKYAFLSPGDGITVEYPRGTWRLWRITSMTDTGALCEFNVEPGDAELYTQTAVGATGYVPQEVAPLAPPTRLQLLDIPILRDQDNNAGIYAALDNYGPGWSGAGLLVGYDDANLISRGTVSTDAPIGFAETVLGAAPSTFVDESNVFTVSIGNNDFSSVTRDVLLANGGEFWVYGMPGRWEIGASAVGNSLGGGRYILSSHLRGLFGTEANAALHQAGDVFVLLRIAGMLRPAMGVGDIGLAQKYRAISKGRSPNSAASQTYTNTGEGLMPLSPVNLRRSDANDLSVDRRSRLAMNNSTGALPLGEVVEAWSWEFYAAGDFLTRLGTALTSTATVTSAQITATGATPSGTLHVRVAQVSDSVGRGHELQATI